MPRVPRNWVPGLGAHLISRFVDRRFLLVGDDDRRLLLDAVGRAQRRWDWSWLSWAAMSSHTHFGLVAGEVAPERFFRSAHTAFAMRYHRQRGGETLGPVFADRPQLYAVERAGLARLVAYHHRNPVRAGVVDRASRSTWTSHRVYLRLDPAPGWFNVERALEILGFSDTAAGRRAFDDFVMTADLHTGTIYEIPTEAAVPRVAAPLAIDMDQLIFAARAVTGLSPQYPIESRTRRAAETRLVIALVATSDLGQTHSSVARALHMSAGGLSKLLARSQGQHEVNERVVLYRKLVADITRVAASAQGSMTRSVQPSAHDTKSVPGPAHGDMTRSVPTTT